MQPLPPLTTQIACPPHQLRYLASIHRSGCSLERGRRRGRSDLVAQAVGGSLATAVESSALLQQRKQEGLIVPVLWVSEVGVELV